MSRGETGARARITDFLSFVYVHVEPPRDETRLTFDSHNFNLYSLRKSAVCLTTLLVPHSTQASMSKWLFKKELGRTWKKVVVTELRVGLLSNSVPEVSKTTKPFRINELSTEMLVE